MSKEVFQEVQRFKQWWIWIPLLLISFISFSSLSKDGEVGSSDILLTAGILLSVFAILLSSRLKSKISEEGIYVQFVPFHFSPHFYPWEAIYSAEVVRYNPLSDFGGWGYRISLRGKGKAYNVKGDQGIQLIMNDGKKLLIGTQLPQEAQRILSLYQPSK